MNKILEKIKSFFFKIEIKEKYEKRNKKLLDKINNEMSYFKNASYSNPHVPVSERIKTYYEIKGIKSQIWNNRFIIFLTFIIVLLTALQIGTQWEIQKLNEEYRVSKNPVIEPYLIDKQYNMYFSQDKLADLIVENLDYDFENNSKFWPRKEKLRLIVRNTGQAETGSAYIKLTDDSGELYAVSPDSFSLAPLSFKYLEFPFWLGYCYGSTGKLEYLRYKKECDKDLLSLGLHKMFLEINCDSCQWIENPQCYSFNICVYNNTAGLNECNEILSPEEFKFNRINCPSD